MKLKKILNLTIMLFLILISLSFVCIINNVYAGQVAGGTLTGDINSLDENYYPYYKNLINSLKASHPNYNFQLYYTGLVWNECINAESQSHGSSPLNLFQPKTNYQGIWYCPICGTKKYDNGSLCCASREAIAYMMDPRNSINESDIFQFKTLEGADASRDDIARVVSGKGSYLNNPEAIQAIYDASVQYNINGYFLVAKIINEHGNNGSTLTAGNGYGGNYVGYYNYFNVGSYGNGTAAIINNGLSYAKSKGWNSIRASIFGGAEIVKNNYITTRKQKTLYFQKFNVVYKSALFSYQYQANLMAAQSQGSSLKSYYGSNANTQSMTFIIPIYEGMPPTPSLRPDTTKVNSTTYENGIIKNVKSSLTVRAGEGLKALAIGKLNGEESIKIIKRATTMVDGYYWDMIVSNKTGTFGYAARIVGGDTCIVGLGTTGTSGGIAESTAPLPTPTPTPTPVPTPTPTPTPEPPQVTPKAEVVFEEDKVLATPIASYETIKSQNADAIIKNANGEEITSGNIATGYTVSVDGKTYTVIKKGDLNSDGNVNILDTIVLLNHLKGTNVLTGVNEEASKISNQTATIIDVVKILNYIKGISDISIK